MIIGPLVSIAISVLSFLYILLYPRLLAVRRIRSVERNLLYALRHMAVQVKAGVTLFDSLVYISKKDYGVISEEFAKCTKRISTGTPTTEALDEIALRNPSLPFRRSIWQLSNSMRAGVDIGNTLESMVKNLSDEHRVAIRTYGSQLSPLTMMYMMLAVIIPSLGITFLVILGSFSGILISETIFWMILLLLLFFQFSFVGIVKSRRPSIEV
jgi:pilus assembly protein TadC